MEKLPLRPIHGNTLIVLPYTKASLSRLEEMTAKIQTRADPKAPKKEENCVNMGTIRIGANGPGGPAPMMMGRPGPGPVGGPGPSPLIIRPGGPLVMGPGPIGPGGPMNRGPMPLIINGQPPLNQGPPIMGRSMGPPGVGPMGPVQSQLPPGAPRPLMSAPGPVPLGAPSVMQQGPPPGMQARPPPGMSFSGAPGHSPSGPIGPTPSMMTAPPGMRIAGGPPGSGPQHQMPPLGAHVNPQMFPGMQPPHGAVQGGLSDAEFEEIMNRNRTVSSSAISRAVADASSGDVKSATETILTAISLIKQSRVAHDDRCRMLIASLQDTLSGIESKAFSGSSRSKHRDRSRSRSRERDRKRRRRSRSRSRTRSRSPRHSRSRHY